MDAYGLPVSPQFDRSVFNGTAQTAGTSWQTYIIPSGKSMLSIFMLGGGGGGGSGVVGANSTAAGGGGGGSGGQTIIEIPTALLPQRLYVSVGQAKTGAGIASYVSTFPGIATSNHVVGIANGGGAGGNGAGATAGAAGAAGAIATNATMPLGWAWSKLALAGQAGIIGGTTVAGGALAYPTTGLRCTGGVGGGGLPAAATTGTAGGAITAIATPSFFIGAAGGAAQATATSPANPGTHGFMIQEAGFFFQGGTGGGSTHGTATGGGLVQAPGGNGAIGSGGGGMGGALTGSTAASLSYGGPGIVIITAY